MNVLAVSASPRKGGNSDVLCDQLLKGAKVSGANVNKIRVVEKGLAVSGRRVDSAKQAETQENTTDNSEVLQSVAFAKEVNMTINSLIDGNYRCRKQLLSP